MRCPCGQADISAHDLRAWLRAEREARVAASQVMRGDLVAGQITRHEQMSDGRALLIVAPDVEPVRELSWWERLLGRCGRD